MEEVSQESVEINPKITENNGNNEKSTQEKPETSTDAVEKTSAENSEYDSAGSYSDDENRKIRSRASNQDADSHSESETEASVTLEREEGDGQESVPAKKVDDDEDKKNPQYIPKRGTFYEHDDRTADDVETIEAGEVDKGEKDGKKKVWQDKKEKWSHDRFNDSEQAPKSRSELVSIYGYDIRNEDGPPRARRRRRYGRGPNKYTRNWEDEDAYNKPPTTITRVKKTPRPNRTRNGEEFPPLGNATSRSPDDQACSEDGPDNKEQLNNRQSTERTEHVQETNGNSNIASHTSSYENRNAETIHPEPPQNKPIQQRVGSGRVVKPKKEIKDSDYRGFTTKTRQVRNIKTDQQQQKVMPPRNQKKDDFIQSQNFTNKNNNLQDIEKDMSKLNVQDGIYKGGKHNNQRQGSVPPRLQQGEQKGSKRYSSMRQRSLPESATPPNFPTTFYPNEYNQQTPQQPAQAIIHQNPQIHPATNQVAQMQPPAALPPIPQQVPVTAAPLLQPQFPPPFPQAPPPFLQPGVAPPAFIPPQTPQIINYVQGQPAFTPNYQGFQQQFNPVTQPTELYQPQGGITYYSTDQQIAQRPVPQKRPKAAIPIVAPPQIDVRGRIRKDDDSVASDGSGPERIDNFSNISEEIVDVQQ